MKEDEENEWRLQVTTSLLTLPSPMQQFSSFGVMLTHPMHYRALFSTHAHVLLWYRFTNAWQRVTKPWSFETDQTIVSHWNGVHTKIGSQNERVNNTNADRTLFPWRSRIMFVLSIITRLSWIHCLTKAQRCNIFLRTFWLVCSKRKNLFLLFFSTFIEIIFSILFDCSFHTILFSQHKHLKCISTTVDWQSKNKTCDLIYKLRCTICPLSFVQCHRLLSTDRIIATNQIEVKNQHSSIIWTEMCKL